MTFYTVCMSGSADQYLTIEADSFDEARDIAQSTFELDPEEVHYSDFEVHSVEDNATNETRYYE